MNTWHAGTNRIETDSYIIMGILNITPDSFYDRSRYSGLEEALKKTGSMLEEGADIIDVGGESSRPGSEPVTTEEELNRVIPVIQGIAKSYPKAIISCDTYKAKVAQSALDAGAVIINDISAFSMDPELIKTICGSGCGYVLMHMQGTPGNMQSRPRYKNPLKEVKSFLCEKIDYMKSAGIDASRIVIDPGIGFGKRIEDNLKILNGLDSFRELKRPVLIGTSRKSFIGKILGMETDDRLEGSIASAVASYMKGARIFRVHDVAETRRGLATAAAINNAGY